MKPNWCPTCGKTTGHGLDCLDCLEAKQPMTTDEKLDAIVAKCYDNIALAEGMIPCAAGVYLADLKYSIAGWCSTIAAIAGLKRGIHGIQDYATIQTILSAWEGLV